MINEQHRGFLLALATDEVRHSGRSLFAHLVGTHDLLQAWGNSEPVCTAGLFHSIYGTRYFRHQTWPLDDRETIEKLIGREAELLAYVFCTVNRPKTLFDGMWPLALLEIEAANLLEQRSKSKWLPRLRETSISDAAKRAIDEYLHANARAA